MFPAQRLAVGLLIAGMTLATACREEKKAAAPAPPPPTAAAPDPGSVQQAALKQEAKELFAAQCSNCHGVNGAGNGPGSKDLEPKPRNFQDPAWQTSVTNAYIEQIMVQGGAAVGKSAVMPAQPDLAGKPELVTALREYIRTFVR